MAPPPLLPPKPNAARTAAAVAAAAAKSAAKKDDALSVTVRIMSRDYTVTCPADEHEALVASADYLNQRMTGIRRRGKALGAERIAVMTALNLARELLTLKGEGGVAKPDVDAIARLKALGTDIDKTLDTPE